MVLSRAADGDAHVYTGHELTEAAANLVRYATLSDLLILIIAMGMGLEPLVAAQHADTQRASHTQPLGPPGCAMPLAAPVASPHARPTRGGAAGAVRAVP